MPNQVPTADREYQASITIVQPGYVGAVYTYEDINDTYNPSGAGTPYRSVSYTVDASESIAAFESPSEQRSETRRLAAEAQAKRRAAEVQAAALARTLNADELLMLAASAEGNTVRLTARRNFYTAAPRLEFRVSNGGHSAEPPRVTYQAFRAPGAQSSSHADVES